jgi:hypothetical protein
MKAKVIVLLSACLSVFASASAQVRTDISLRERNNSVLSTADFGYNSNDYCIGVGIGSGKVYGDLPFSNPQPVYIVDVNKFTSPSFSYGWQAMIGDLSARDPYTHLRSFNHFTSIDMHMNLGLGTFINLFRRDYEETPVLKLLSFVHTGIGIGIINNDIKRIASVNFDKWPGAQSTTNPEVLQKSTAIFIPLNLGFSYHIKRLWKFNGCMFYANYQYNMGMSDYIDGYMPPYKANKRNDVFTVASLGFRFYIHGGGGSAEY